MPALRLLAAALALAASTPAVPVKLPPMPQQTGYLERRADGTCWWNYGMYYCPPRAMCKPTPPFQQVACPPLAQPVDATVADRAGAYTESRNHAECLTGPDATHLRRMACPWEGEKP